MVESNAESPISNVQAEPTQTVDPRGTAQNSEPMVPQSKVNEVVGRYKAESYEKGKRDAFTEFQQQQQAQNQNVNQNIGGMKVPTPDEIAKLVDEQISKRTQEAQSYQIANDFMSKVNAVSEKYPDIKTKDVDALFSKIPTVAWWANQLPNTGEVVAELMKNPTKLVQIKQMIELSPELAQQELVNLSNSIQTNMAAASAKTANEPLSQIKPSTSTIGTDNGSMSVRDFKKRYRN